ncbi:MAG: nucleotidyltransferase domain-containing protein [Halioglobus sp.]|nr:nucleotidyltransferase domain-containing protein [Halioglobus sp.]
MQAELDRIADYLAAQDDLRLAIVYGSLATGQARLDSDLDIAVAGDQPLDADRKMALIRGLARVCGRAIDLVDLTTVGEPLLGQILNGGKRLLGNNRHYAELVTRHLFDQADFLPYRERLLADRRKLWIRQ